MLRQSLFLFIYFFRSRSLQDRRADLHEIFEEDGKWAATTKFGFWFLNSFGGGMEVHKGHVPFGLTFTKCNITAKRIHLSKKKAVWSWPDDFSTNKVENRAKIHQWTTEILWCICFKCRLVDTAEQKSMIWFISLDGATWRHHYKPRECKHGDARLTTLQC